jgi:two-component system OmpR family sensor kinase
VHRQLSLRTRLILGVIVLAAVGLLVADVATYSSLRSFLIDQTDHSLEDAHRAVEFQLREPAPFPQRGPADREIHGFCVQIRRGESIVRNDCATQFPGEREPVAPAYPQSVSLPDEPNAGGDRTRFLTVGARGGSGRYRVRAWTDDSAPGYVFFLAAPLKSVDSTLHRLLLIELLVTAAVLAGLVALGLWVVRVGLRPLQEIESTAAKIADGDLTQRIEREDESTEIGRLGHSLNVMLAQIEAGYRAREESEQRLRRFVADASHELRTPLAAVRAYAELFERGAATRPDDLARSMTGINRESERMSLLVDDLLLLARLDEGRPLERKPVDLAQVVGEAVDAARVVEPERPIELSVEPVTVTGDEARLRQVLDNLFANARSHTPAGTAVSVALEQVDGHAKLSVADHGGGLSEEEAARVFERFYRADSSRARASGGVGLGLSIVAAVTEAHGGSAEAKPTPGGGATFVVTLPLAAVPTPSGTRTAG